MKINFASNIFHLQNDGSLYWPLYKSIILADLHLEKASYFAYHDITNLPPYDSLNTIDKLNIKLKGLSVEKIILLGDIFHDKDGYKRLQKATKNKLENLCKQYEVIWMVGNHDGLYSPKHSNLCVTYNLDAITFTHVSKQNSPYEISGHYHPKAAFKLNGRKITKPCFLINEKKIIMPAYGSYTGGMSSQDHIFKQIFKSAFNTYIISEKKVFLIK